MSWRVGSKVVCINDRWLPASCATALPEKDKVYVVRGVADKAIPCGTANLLRVMVFGESLPGLLLREITNSACECWETAERPFDQTAFRPVIEDESKSKAAVEALKKLADTVKQPEKVR